MEGHNRTLLKDYILQALGDVYLWRVSRRWRTTTNFEEADVVLLLTFPIISKYASEYKCTTHESRYRDVYDWTSFNFLSTLPTAVMCPSWKWCYKNKKMKENVTNVRS